MPLRVKSLVKSETSDSVDFVHGGLELFGLGVFDPFFHRCSDRIGRFVADSHDEREVEVVPIPLVQPLERLVLVRAQLVEAGGGLFLDGGVRHLGLLAEVRMSP